MKQLVWITAIVIGVLAGLAVLWMLRGVVLLFLFSLWTAAALRPATDYLRRRGLGPSLALALTYLSVLGVLIAIVLMSTAPLLREVQQVMDDGVSAFDQVMETWPQGTATQKWIASRLPDPEELYDAIIKNWGWSTMQPLLGFTAGLFGGIVNLVVIVVLSLYWTIDRIHFERLWLSLLNVDQRAQARSIWRAIEHEVGAYLRSEVLQCVLGGFVLYAGFRVIGYPYPTLLAIVAAVCWLIPWIGMILAALAAFIFALPILVQNGAPAIVITAAAILFALAVMLVLEMWVEPRLFHRQSFNSLWIVLVVVGLADSVGMIGLILGPPLAAALQVVGAHILRQRLTEHIHEGVPSLTVNERLLGLRAALAGMSDPSPGLLSLADRLETLVRESDELRKQSTGGSSVIVYPNPADASALGA